MGKAAQRGKEVAPDLGMYSQEGVKRMPLAARYGVKKSKKLTRGLSSHLIVADAYHPTSPGRMVTRRLFGRVR